LLRIVGKTSRRLLRRAVVAGGLSLKGEG